MKIAISDYKTGKEIWRGEIDKQMWHKYLAQADKDTGACRSDVLLDRGLVTGQVPPATIFCEQI